MTFQPQKEALESPLRIFKAAQFGHLSRSLAVRDNLGLQRHRSRLDHR